jgi:hypothetical protein
MAKSSRGGKTSYEKQDAIISQFERINRQQAWEAKHGKQNLTLSEQLLRDSQIRKEKAAKQPKQEKRIFSPAYAYNYVYGNKPNK